MKKYASYLLMTLCLVGHLHAEKGTSFFGDIAARCTWDFDMRKKLDNVLKTIISDQKERGEWMLNGSEEVGDYNLIASAEWKPKRDAGKLPSESIRCMFVNAKKMHGRRYRSMEEYFNASLNYEREKSKTSISAECKKINDLEGIIEIESSDGKKIIRAIFDGDWVIKLEYYVNKHKSPEKLALWEDHRDFWLQRFAPIRFN